MPLSYCVTFYGFREGLLRIPRFNYGTQVLSLCELLREKELGSFHVTFLFKNEFPTRHPFFRRLSLRRCLDRAQSGLRL